MVHEDKNHKHAKWHASVLVLQNHMGMLVMVDIYGIQNPDMQDNPEKHHTADNLNTVDFYNISV